MSTTLLKEILDEQIVAHRGINLFSDDSMEAFRFSERILESFNEFAKMGDEETAILVEHVKNETMAEFCRVNQYYSIDSAARQNLEEIYLLLLDEIRSYQREDGDNSVKEIARRHFSRLRQLLKQSNSFAETQYSNRPSVLEPVPCFEYSPSLQLDILGIDLNDLAEPVLDIGCGKEARLVEHLRSQGISAFGVDRLAEPASYLIKADWTEFGFGSNQWGTVLSHLGFSNHFIHHHHRADGDFVRYAQTYMSILASLKIGGRFYYTPGLDFIEQHLDCRPFSIFRKRLKNGFNAVVVKRKRFVDE